jgi:hypothetical protein
MHRVWRTWRRADWALTVLVVNGIALAGFLSIVTSGIVGCVEATDDTGLGAFWDRDWPGLVLLLGVLPLLLGAWLTAGLAHWPRGTAWLCFGGLVAGHLVLVNAIMAIGDIQQWRSLELRSAITTTGWLEPRIDALLRGVTLLWLMMLVALGGVLPGRMIRAMLGRWRRALWRRRHRRGRR